LIVVKEKPVEKLLEMTKNLRNVLVVGCNGCAGIYQVGGEKQAQATSMLLEMASRAHQGSLNKARHATVLRQCDKQLVATSLRPILEEYDGILSLGCGAGVQTLAEAFPEKMVLPGNDTVFIGAQERELGKLYELCRACGDCILDETGGICPVTRCAKSLMNGPCGGQAKGKCEVGGWKKDCAWVLIYDRLKERGRLDLFTMYRPPRDFRVSQPPREIGGDIGVRA